MTGRRIPAGRRWAVVLVNAQGHATVTASFWMRHRADRIVHLAGIERRAQNLPRLHIRVEPTDWAPADTIGVRLLDELGRGPASITTLAQRTALSPARIEHVLLHLARRGLVVHRYYAPEPPGAWHHQGQWALPAGSARTTA